MQLIQKTDEKLQLIQKKESGNANSHEKEAENGQFRPKKGLFRPKRGQNRLRAGHVESKTGQNQVPMSQILETRTNN